MELAISMFSTHVAIFAQYLTKSGHNDSRLAYDSTIDAIQAYIADDNEVTFARGLLTKNKHNRDGVRNVV